jgi:hypothetical protein
MNNQQLDGLLRAFDTWQAAEKLTDRELADEVITKVWGKLHLGSREDFILSELIDRFEKQAGIERGEEETL